MGGVRGGNREANEGAIAASQVAEMAVGKK